MSLSYHGLSFLYQLNRVSNMKGGSRDFEYGSANPAHIDGLSGD
jgi:hypothetical protein